MRKIASLGVAAALALALMLVPGTATARKHHKAHKACAMGARVDRNHDGIPDRWECRHRLSLRVNQANKDQDHDGLNNKGEFQAGDDPHNPDTDHNGIPDGEEHAGTIKSFDPSTGMLVITPDGGGADVSGVVNASTEIECKGAEHSSTEAHSSSDSGGDQNSTSEHSSTQSGETQSQTETQNGQTETQSQTEQEHGNCTTADLKPGTPVHEAELKVENGQQVFESVELEVPAATPGSTTS